MALEDEVVAPEAEPSAADTSVMPPEEETDLRIGVMLAQKMIDEGGIDVIEEAIKTSKDPGQVVGQFLMQMVVQMAESMPREMQLSPRIYFAHGGWVEQVSDYLQEEYGIDQKIMDRAEMYIGGQAEQMAQGQAQQAVQGAQPVPGAGAPMAPTGAAPTAQTGALPVMPQGMV